jgi:hypothetical protein
MQISCACDRLPKRTGEKPEKHSLPSWSRSMSTVTSHVDGAYIPLSYKKAGNYPKLEVHIESQDDSVSEIFLPKTQNLRLIKRKAAEKSQERGIPQLPSSFLQNCQGHQKQGKSRKLSSEEQPKEIRRLDGCGGGEGILKQKRKVRKKTNKS